MNTRKLEKRGKIALARLLAPFAGARPVPASAIDRLDVRRLLLIRQHNQMGDMLLAGPVFRGLRRRFPDARISLLAAPINTDVMLNSPWVDEVFVYAKKAGHRNPFALAGFVRELRRRQFDVAIVLGSVSFSVTSMLLAAASGARVRIGVTSAPFGHDLSSRYYNVELPVAPENEPMHESERNLFPLRAIGVDETDLSPLLVPTAAEEASAAAFVGERLGDSPFVVIHPGAGKRRNIWPPERFAAVATRLGETRGLGVVAVSGPVDAPVLARLLAAGIEPAATVTRPPVGFLGALMRRAALVLCNDTGVMHVAGAVGARCVAVFGPTDPSRWKPAVDSVVAVQGPDGTVESVTVGMVVDAVEKILG